MSHVPKASSPTPDAQTALRNKLKVALQYAKQLFDDGLVDVSEFRDLKATELTKYKEQLANLAASPKSAHAPQKETPPKAPPSRQSILLAAPPKTPPPHKTLRITSPPTSRRLCSSSNPPPGGATVLASPRTPDKSPQSGAKGVGVGSTSAVARTPLRDPVYLDVHTYCRLTTPPIFRRRTRKRRIVVPSAELRALNSARTPSRSHSHSHSQSHSRSRSRSRSTSPPS